MIVGYRMQTEDSTTKKCHHWEAEPTGKASQITATHQPEFLYKFRVMIRHSRNISSKMYVPQPHPAEGP